MTEPIARSDALDIALAGGAEDEIRRLFTFSRRTRHITYLLICSVILDVILSCGLGVVAMQARDATSTAHNNRHDAKVTCEAANIARAANITLWDYVLSFPSPAPRTPAQDAQISAFKLFVANTFAPRKC